jgi:hypothetical protein
MKAKEKLLSTIVFICAISFLPILFELVLRYTEILDQLESDTPSYIPEKITKINDENNKIGFITSEGFRYWSPSESLLGSLKKETGCKVVVLGDSFVWGYGLPSEDSWPSQLERLSGCKVFPFGKNGWTSIEQFSFYEKNLIDLDFDYLLIGVVSNDPHPRGNFRQFSYAENVYQRSQFGLMNLMPKIIRPLFEWSFFYHYIKQVTENLISATLSSKGDLATGEIKNWGYGNWEKRLYEDDVYSKWISAIIEFKKIAKHPHCFLLTPTDISTRQEEIFNKISMTFKKLNVYHFNSFKNLQNTFTEGYRPRNEWANISDPHPGKLQNSVFADKAMTILQENIL